MKYDEENEIESEIENEIEDETDNARKKTRSGNNATLIAIIFIMLITVAIVSYQPNSLSNGDKSINGNISETNWTNMSTEEKNFRTWFVLSYIPIRDSLKCLSKAAKSENFSQTETCARLLKEDSNRSLNQIDSYNTSNISTDLKSALGLYRISLENYYMGGENLEIGARNENTSKMGIAIQYVQNGTAYANDAMILLKKDDKSGIGISSKGVKFD